MTAEEFVINSKKLILTKEEIIQNDLLETYNKEFDIQGNNKSLPKINHYLNNEIFNFMNNYNTENYFVLKVFFDDEISIEDNRVYFAFTDYERLFINLDNNEIQAVDYEDSNMIENVAKNDFYFFDVLNIFLEYSSNCLRKNIDFRDENINKQYYDLCVKAAGGVKYKMFYKNIFS